MNSKYLDALKAIGITLLIFGGVPLMLILFDVIDEIVKSHPLILMIVTNCIVAGIIMIVSAVPICFAIVVYDDLRKERLKTKDE